MEEKGFTLRDIENQNSFQNGIRTTDTWVMGRALLPLSYLIHMPLFTYQSSERTYLKLITNCEEFRAKCCVTIAAALTSDTRDIFLVTF